MYQNRRKIIKEPCLAQCLKVKNQSPVAADVSIHALPAALAPLQELEGLYGRGLLRRSTFHRVKGDQRISESKPLTTFCSSKRRKLARKSTGTRVGNINACTGGGNILVIADAADVAYSNLALSPRVNSKQAYLCSRHGEPYLASFPSGHDTDDHK